jgi:hypothetical protein
MSSEPPTIMFAHTWLLLCVAKTTKKHPHYAAACSPLKRSLLRHGDGNGPSLSFGGILGIIANMAEFARLGVAARYNARIPQDG